MTYAPDIIPAEERQRYADVLPLADVLAHFGRR